MGPIISGTFILKHRIINGVDSYGDPDFQWVQYEIAGELQPVRENEIQIEPGREIRHYKRLFLPAQQGAGKVEPEQLDRIIDVDGSELEVTHVEPWAIGDTVVFKEATLRLIISED